MATDRSKKMIVTIDGVNFVVNLSYEAQLIIDGKKDFDIVDFVKDTLGNGIPVGSANIMNYLVNNDIKRRKENGS